MQAICSGWTKDRLTEMDRLHSLRPLWQAWLCLFVFVTGCSSQFTHGFQIPSSLPGPAALQYRVVPKVANSLLEKKRAQEEKIKCFLISLSHQAT